MCTYLFIVALFSYFNGDYDMRALDYVNVSVAGMIVLTYFLIVYKVHDMSGWRVVTLLVSPVIATVSMLTVNTPTMLVIVEIFLAVVGYFFEDRYDHPNLWKELKE